MQYTIENEKLKIVVDSFGAELCSVKQGEREWLWQNPTGNWAGHSPLLFPICGLVDCTVNGVKYDLPRHGLARKSEFTFVAQGENFLRFALKSNENTKKLYPFDFTYEVTYTIDGAKLKITHAVKNDGDTPMYFMCGGHESFALPTTADQYAIEFEKEEQLIHYFHSQTGMTGATLDFGKVKFLPVPTQIMENNDTAIFKNILSRTVWLCEKNGKRLAKITFADEFKNLLIWRCLNDPFLCVEPWTNVLDTDGAPSVEFSKKEGTVKVEVGETKVLERSVEYL